MSKQIKFSKCLQQVVCILRMLSHQTAYLIYFTYTKTDGKKKSKRLKTVNKTDP